MIRLKDVRFLLYSIMILYIFYLTTPYLHNEIEDPIKPHYIEFMTLVTKYCTEKQYFHPKHKIQFRNLTDNIIGLCITYPKSYIIYLDKSFWKSNGELQRFQLVAHELSHCILGKEHVDNPNHYMASYYNDIPKDELYKQIKGVLKDKCQ